MTKTAIFLGAGASKAEGAPLQGELFRDYFSSCRLRRDGDVMDRELATFFRLMFGIDVEGGDVHDIEFPTFEEVLGLTDLAILRKESFRSLDIENRAVNSGMLMYIAQYLVFLVAKVLDEKLRDGQGVHRDLVRKLHYANELKNTVFISANYDILIDNALSDLYNQIDLDYGVEFRNFDRKGDWKRPRRNRSVTILKPHGSLNWLFCPTCNELEITPSEKGVVTRLISDYEQASCPVCNSVYAPLIIPPSFYKDMSNAFLSSIWNRSEHALRRVEHVVFCGYSFPDADMHIKYLIKRAQTNRDRSLRFTVINNFPGKSKDACKEEKYRFKRFLGRDVLYTDLSFEQFADDPVAVLA